MRAEGGGSAPGAALRTRARFAGAAMMKCGVDLGGLVAYREARGARASRWLSAAWAFEDNAGHPRVGGVTGVAM